MAKLHLPTKAVRWSKRGKFHLITVTYPGSEDHPATSCRVACKQWVFNMGDLQVELVDVKDIPHDQLCGNCWPFEASA